MAQPSGSVLPIYGGGGGGSRGGGGDSGGACSPYSASGRTPTAAELAHWESAFAGGGTYEDLQISILGSAEYYTHTGSNDIGFINRLYIDTIRREPTPAELSEAEARVAGASTGRTDEARAVVLSAEWRSLLVQITYPRAMGRGPTAAELAYWVNLLPRPGAERSPAAQTFEQFAATLLASPEHYTHVGATPEAFMDDLYTFYLGRSRGPSDTGDGGDIAAIRAGTRDAQLHAAQRILSSREYYDNLITAVYRQYLHDTCPQFILSRCSTVRRVPTDAELRNWLTSFSTGASEEDLVAALVGSDEYYFNHNGGSQSAFIHSAYQDLLGRDATAAEVSAASTAYSNDRGGRSAFAQAMVRGDDYRGTVVTWDYDHFQLRLPSGAEFTAGRTYLASPPRPFRGTPQESYIGTIGQSDEYYGHSEGTDTTWIRHISGDLGQPSTAAQEAHWLGLTPHDTAWRYSVALDIATGDGYHTDVIRGAYEKYLSHTVCAAFTGPAGFHFPGGWFGLGGLVLLLLLLGGGGAYLLFGWDRGGATIGSDETGGIPAVQRGLKMDEAGIENDQRGLKIREAGIENDQRGLKIREAAIGSDESGLKLDDSGIGTDHKLGETGLKGEDTAIKGEGGYKPQDAGLKMDPSDTGGLKLDDSGLKLDDSSLKLNDASNTIGGQPTDVKFGDGSVHKLGEDLGHIEK